MWILKSSSLSFQVASCTNHMGQVSIVALQNSNPKVTECFNVESRILCMTYVPLDEPLENSEGKPEDWKANDTPTVCLGMEEGRCVHHLKHPQTTYEEGA